MQTQIHPADVPSAAHIARAIGFTASLFLGAGKFDKIEGLSSIDEARKAVDELRLRNPMCTRRPMVYAALPEGKQEWVDHTAPLPSDGDNPTDDEAAAGQAEEARHCPPPMAGTVTQQAEEADMPAKTYSDRSNCRAAAKKAGIPADEIIVRQIGERFAFSRKPQPKAEPAKPKAAAKPAKKTAEAKPPAGKRAAIMDAAKAGKMPTPPDFSAETHARFRKKLGEIVALAKAGDIKGLKAVEINPISSSPKAMDRYRNLAVIALQAKAAG